MQSTLFKMDTFMMGTKIIDHHIKSNKNIKGSKER